MNKYEALKIRQILDNPDLSNNERMWEVSLLVDEALEHPPKWQGLTDDEIDALEHNDFTCWGRDDLIVFGRAIEAKLKEKNT